jgi:hypothetical protein
VWKTENKWQKLKKRKNHWRKLGRKQVGTSFYGIWFLSSSEHFITTESYWSFWGVCVYGSKFSPPDFHAKMPAYGWFVDVIQQMPFQNKKHQGFYSVKIGISAPNMRIQRSMQTPHSWGQMVGHCMTSRSKSWLSKQVWSSTMWGMDTVYAIREYMYIYRYEGFHYLVYN